MLGVALDMSHLAVHHKGKMTRKKYPSQRARPCLEDWTHMEWRCMWNSGAKSEYRIVLISSKWYLLVYLYRG